MKNQNGISLIALIITIIVIIILAAIVIGGAFNTPDDAKFANFCQEYDRVQTAIQLKYYDVYQKYALQLSTDVTPTHFNMYNEVATGTKFDGTTVTRDDVDNWVEITNWGKANTNVCEKPSLAGTWFLRESDGKLVYSGFEKGEKVMYYTPNVKAENTRDTVTTEEAIVALGQGLELAS